MERRSYALLRAGLCLATLCLGAIGAAPGRGAAQVTPADPGVDAPEGEEPGGPEEPAAERAPDAAGTTEAEAGAPEGEAGDGAATEGEPAPTPTGDAPPEAAPETAEAAAEPVDPTPPVAFEWGEGVTFHSDDDLFSLQIRGRLQVQGFVESGISATDPASVDFMARRARLVFRGHLLDAHVEYYVQLGLAPRDMEPDLLVPLRDAQLAWTGLRDLSIRGGVMKVPFSRERVISSSSLQLVDRSIVNAELSLDRDNGLQLYSNDLFGLGGYLGYQIGVFGGDGRLRVNNDLGLLYVVRLQVQPFGRFDDAYSEVDFTREERARLSIGAGFAYNMDTNRRRRTTTDFYQAARFDYMHAEADLIFKYAGFSAQAELLWRQVDGPSQVTNVVDGMDVMETAGNAAGWFVQAGYLFDFAPIEIAARFADIYPIGAVTANRPQREVTVGLNWYPMRHDLKLQLDGSYLATDTGTMGVSAWQERFQMRLQAQAYF